MDLQAYDHPAESIQIEKGNATRHILLSKGRGKKQYVDCPWLQQHVFISTSHAPSIRDRDRKIGSLVELKQFMTVISSYGHSQVACTRAQFSHPKVRSENIFFALWISRLQSKMQ